MNISHYPWSFSNMAESLLPVMIKKNHLDKETAIANLRVMAVSPELLEGLKGFIGIWDINNAKKIEDSPFILRCREAISKAEGESL